MVIINYSLWVLCWEKRKIAVVKGADDGGPMGLAVDWAVSECFHSGTWGLEAV